MKAIQTHIRTFGGILNTTGLPREQRNFEKKHFKAFKNGWTEFSFGFVPRKKGEPQHRQWYNTKVIITENPLAQQAITNATK